jgi:hypothetical protein
MGEIPPRRGGARDDTGQSRVSGGVIFAARRKMPLKMQDVSEKRPYLTSVELDSTKCHCDLEAPRWVQDGPKVIPPGDRTSNPTGLPPPVRRAAYLFHSGVRDAGGR